MKKPKIKSSPRNYTASLVVTRNESKLLKENFNNWQKIFAVGFDRIGTLCGSYLPIGDNFPDEVSEDLLKLMGEDQKESAVSILRTVLAWVNWFPAESQGSKVLLGYDTKKYQVTVDEAIKRFKSYWRSQLGEYSELVLDALVSFKLKSGASFVDRRAAFIDTGFNPVVIQKNFFSVKLLDYEGAFNEKAKEWRNVISSNFGNGAKGNPSWDDSIFEKIQFAIDGQDDKAFLNKEELASLVEEVSGKKGRTPAYLKILSSDSEPTIGQYRKLLSQRQKDKTAPAKEAVSAELHNFIVGEIEKLGLFQFAGNNESFYAAYAQPWGQIMSNRSNCVRRILEQTALLSSNLKLAVEAPEEIGLLHQFCDEMRTKLGVDAYVVREHQDNGIEEFFAELNKGASVEDAIKATAAALGLRLLKNSNQQLLEFLQRERCFNVDKIRKAVQWSYQQEKIDNAQLGAVADVIDSPMRPVYGVSKLKGWLVGNNVELELVTNNGLVTKTFEYRSNRAKREFLSGTKSGKKMPRSDYHHNPGKEQKPYQLLLDRGEDKHALTVFQKENGQGDLKWYIGITPKIGYIEPVSLKDIEKFILGIDSGWRNPAAFTILRNNELVENGFLDFECLSFGKYLSVFEKSHTAPADMIRFYKKLCARNSIDSFEAPSFCNLVNQCVKMLGKEIRNKVTDQLVDEIKIVIEFVSPHFLNKKSQEIRTAQGRLSYERMEMMRNLARLASKLCSLSEEQNYKLGDDFPKIRQRILTKETNLKNERSRITGRMILNKAVKAGCKVIVFEDLEIRSDRRKSKWLNVGVCRWYVSRIIAFLETEAPMYGIRVIKVSPNYSSHQDVDGSWICRLLSVNPQTLPAKTVKGKHYPSIESISRKLADFCKGTGTSETDKIYTKAAIDFLNGDTFEKIIEREKAAGTTQLLVPYRGGEYCKSKILGVVHSDILASNVLAQRGCERLDAIKNPKTARKT